MKNIIDLINQVDEIERETEDVELENINEEEFLKNSSSEVLCNIVIINRYLRNP